MKTAIDLAACAGVMVALFSGLWLGALAVGQGRCMTCRKLIPPMNAYCAQHWAGSAAEDEPPGQ